MVRKKDLITLCERHPDCEFLSFTNGTLIDEEFCKEMIRVKNFVPAISLEGFEGANDGRRGKGVFTKVQNAMKLLKKHNLPFGISTCYTSANYQDITSEAFHFFKGYLNELIKTLVNIANFLIHVIHLQVIVIHIICKK